MGMKKPSLLGALLRRHMMSSSAADGYYEKFLVVQPRLRPPALLRGKLMEALRLAQSLCQHEMGKAAALPSYALVQNKKRINPASYFGAGTIDNIRVHLHVLDVESSGGEVDAVFVNVPLSGVQQRNLEDAWERPVLDRVGLIIQIFGSRARSSEAKLQVELATLDYQKSRLVRIMGKGGRQGFGAGGEQEVVSAKGRSSGGGGRGFTSGSGETELQLQRRRISEKRHKLELMLAKVRQTRSIHRSSREGMPVVAVVGYTNAGKSTLVGALSRSDLYADDRLFATLDTQLRSVYLPSGRKVLLSDTVGFISDLPTQLVRAFRATLEEVVLADVVLHVMDSSASNMEEQREAVLEVLKEIGVSQEALEEKTIEVLNKIDVVPGADDGAELVMGMLSGEEDDGETALLTTVETALQEAPSETAALREAASAGSREGTKSEMSSSDDEEVWGTRLMMNGKLPRVATSALEGTGLDTLLQAIDATLMKSKLLNH